MTPLAQAVSGALLQFVWQGFLVAFLVSVAMYLLRKQGPQIRYLIYCAALLILAALPVITAIALYDPFASARPGPATITLTIRGVWNGGVSPAAGFIERWLTAAEPWILPVWILGVAFLSLRLAWLGTRVSGLKRSGGPPDRLILLMANALARRMGMRRAIRILVSVMPDGPSVIGWIRPAILLPAATIFNLTPDQLEAILAHEIAHLRRYDDIVNIAQSVIETLLFYHPAVWWMSNRIRHERELCCDDLAVRASGNAICYARALTALERFRVSPGALALGALGDTGTPLEYRIRRIVDSQTTEIRSSTIPGILALSLAATCLAIYSIPANGGAPPPPARIEYPESARVNGIQGIVPVQIQLDDLGGVSDARAIGGPKELRQAAEKAVAAQHFDPDTTGSTERIDVAFQLAPQSAVPLQPSPAPSVLRTGPAWKDRAESLIALSATNEKEPTKQLEFLSEWERQYPATDFRAQRTNLTVHALLAVTESAYGKTEPAVLDAGRKAGQQLADRYSEYLDKASGSQVHSVLAWIAQTEGDDVAAESEFRRALAIDPDQARASYLLGVTIIRQVSMNNELTRYVEAIYEFARSLKVTGPSALTPEMKAEALYALKENYGSYHGSTDGLDDVMKVAAASALPPADFNILSAAELSRAHALPEIGDSLTFSATVVSHLSRSRILVKLDGSPLGDAILRFDAGRIGDARSGAPIQFTGVVESYTLEPYVLTFVIRNPATDVAGLNMAPRSGNIVSRVFKGLFRAIRRLA